MAGGRHRKKAAAGEDGRRRYPHAKQSADPTKIAHNDWVCASAREHGSDVLVLDGLDLNTTGRLIAAGVAHDRIHVPNRPDFDALMKRERAAFGGGAAGATPARASGHVYRATAQEFVEAYASLDPPRKPVKTIWLDLNARWGAHVEKTVRSVFASGMFGAGEADLFLTLSRGFHAKQLDEVGGLVAALHRDACVDGALAPVADHTAEYGTGMMILHWRVRTPPPSWYDRLFGAVDAAPLADRLARETRAFRKPQNMRRAAARALAVATVGSRAADAADDDESSPWFDAAVACACADMGLDEDAPVIPPPPDIPLTGDDDPAPPPPRNGGLSGPMKGFAFRAVV